MNRIVRHIYGRLRRVSWVSGTKSDGTRYAVACVTGDDRPLLAIWEGDREPDDEDVVEAVRARLAEEAGNSEDARSVETGMEHSQTSLAINALDDLFRHAARAYEELSIDYDPYDEADPHGWKDVSRAMDAAAEMAGTAARLLTEINDGSRRERAALLQRVWDRAWPGLAQVLRDGATLWVELPDGYAVSIEDGDAFWLSREDILETARDYLADRIAESEGWRRYPGNHPENPEKPEVSALQAHDWAIDGLPPAGVEL